MHMFVHFVSPFMIAFIVAVGWVVCVRLYVYMFVGFLDECPEFSFSKHSPL